MAVNIPKFTFSIVASFLQLLMFVLFVVFVDYAEYNNPSNANWKETGESNSAVQYYSFFQDVHVMIFVGFGFLMTFLKKYSFGAVGYNMFISALVLQWATLINGFITHVFEGETGKIKVDLKTMITSDFAAGAVLITFGAVLGKVSRLQLLVIGVFEVIFYAINENILVAKLKVTDVGGSMVIHMFGAYFGLAVSRLIYREEHGEENDKEGSVYHSDVFAMIGTIFLWMFWPSFNAAMLGPGTQQHRALLNTYYSLAACCIVSFIISSLVNKDSKLDMVHIQNATLAGGVAVGTCADLIIKPWGAILIGMIAGLISTLGYAYVSPLLLKKMKVHDTCGVHNLHGMPAIVAAIAGAITASVATLDVYGEDLFSIWSARIPAVNSTLHREAIEMRIPVSDVTGEERSAGKQAGMQVVAMIVTLVLASVGGAVTGAIIRFLDQPNKHQLYDDESYWLVPDLVPDQPETPEEGILMKERVDEEN